jgi:hypothetical protein
MTSGYCWPNRAAEAPFQVIDAAYGENEMAIDTYQLEGGETASRPPTAGSPCFPPGPLIHACLVARLTHPRLDSAT